MNEINNSSIVELESDWTGIRKHFNRSFGTSLHVSIAGVDKENNPIVTPIGTLFLNNDQTGFYFEKFPTKLPAIADHNPHVCILAVNSSKIFWLKALFRLRFPTYPALKLYGQLGGRRKATEQELNRLKRRMKFTKGLKGNTYLWGKMEFVRELKFTKCEKANLGKMTAGL